MLTLSNPRCEIGFPPFKFIHVCKILHLHLDFCNTDVRLLVFLFRLANLLIERGSPPLGDFNLFHLGCELIFLLVDVGPRKLPFELLNLGMLVAQRLCLGESDHRSLPEVFEIRNNILLLRAHALRCREVLADRVVLLLKELQLRTSEEELVRISIMQYD